MISDPAAIRFVNEQVRPMCQKVRALLVEIESMQMTWELEISKLVPADEKLSVDDGREKEGVSRLTGADINNVMIVLAALAQQKQADVVAKPCVHALQVMS